MYLTNSKVYNTNINPLLMFIFHKLFDLNRLQKVTAPVKR